MSRKFKVVPVMYAASGDVYTLKLQNTEALADLQTLSGSEDIQISHALTMATIQASKALKQAHLMQDSADMLDQADQRDEENNISRMLISKIAQQGE